ncbi:hypothetical protein F5884DRAFT_805076, partial [Xylogone sp. PMI_703]
MCFIILRLCLARVSLSIAQAQARLKWLLSTPFIYMPTDRKPTLLPHFPARQQFTFPFNEYAIKRRNRRKIESNISHTSHMKNVFRTGV